MSVSNKTPLRVLHVEDSEIDSELILSLLETEGFACELIRVDTRQQFLEALENNPFDLVISDYTLPAFDGRSALEIARKKFPEVPFIFVSGTIGEEAAVESLKEGATDYVLKERLGRLSSAVRRAMREMEERRQRKKAQEQIREQAALLDNAQDAICVTDVDQRILYWNKSAERIYEWKVEEAVGKNVNQLLFHGDPALEALKSLIRRERWHGELSQVTRSGRQIMVESRWTLMRDAQGNPKSILIINSDITEKKRMEAQYLRAQRMESIGALAGGIAHDLNNILTPILIAADLLRNQVVNERSKGLVETVETSARRGSELVKQILSFVRGVEAEFKVFQVGAVVAEVLKLLQATLPRSIQALSQVQWDLWPIKGHPTQLHQVLVNLCVNSRDAMPEGGALNIDAENTILERKRTAMRSEPVSGRFVVLTVSDSGAGIPPHLLDKIFEPFFTTKNADKGTGLGLATVFGIVRNHAGLVEVFSEVGKGTIFKVYLPATTSSETEFLREQAERFPRGEREMVLLVDDEAALLEITKTALENFNYDVLTAANGTEAIEVYRAHQAQVSVIITDHTMPIMDGPALIRALRQIDPSVKAIGVSGHGTSANSSTEDWPELQAFLSKPFTTENLLRALRKVLNRADH